MPQKININPNQSKQDHSQANLSQHQIKTEINREFTFENTRTLHVQTRGAWEDSITRTDRDKPRSSEHLTTEPVRKHRAVTCLWYGLSSPQVLPVTPSQTGNSY
ncbi:hypothetical protein RRG08_047114 [Elysia crispata]|uniref:Uncharacterized protein n=1 Tax=Elysia crispata TaxID=231223 RepID=A0AAE1E1U2_9GAST|nr:hypothetical protein RRG08_047114 [Elysia crispata]